MFGLVYLDLDFYIWLMAHPLLVLREMCWARLREFAGEERVTRMGTLLSGLGI